MKRTTRVSASFESTSIPVADLVTFLFGVPSGATVSFKGYRGYSSAPDTVTLSAEWEE